MKRLLSTRILGESQKIALRSGGYLLTEYEAIKVNLLPVVSIPRGRALIFSSKNAVRAFCSAANQEIYQGKPVLCVGATTAKMLHEKGVEVLEIAASARELANLIQEKYNNWSFTYYCGNLRLDTLPRVLDSIGVSWEEIISYETHPVFKKFDKSFDGILFFSPSGVESYTSENTIAGAKAFCIGPTTALSAQKYTDRIYISESPGSGELVDLALREFNRIKS